MLGSLTYLLLPCAAAAGSLSVFGHKAPDTDTTTAALVYAWELNEKKIAATPYILGDLNPETEYVLKTLEVEKPALLGDLAAKADVAIVDTNNPEELPDGIDKAVVHSIVDHHKLVGGLKSSSPLEIDMRAYCSATSILYSRAKAAGLEIPKKIAGLMLAGLLSDSLGFRSPTTTDLDKVHAAELGKLAGLDVTEFANNMLDAKAEIGHLKPDELVLMDSKKFTIGGKKLRVSVIETTKPATPLKISTDLCKAMKDKVVEEKLDDALMFVVDILNEASTVLTCTPTASKIVEKAWDAKPNSEGYIYLPGVLSRKKQMIPKLEAAADKKEDL